MLNWSIFVILILHNSPLLFSLDQEPLTLWYTGVLYNHSYESHNYEPMVHGLLLLHLLIYFPIRSLIIDCDRAVPDLHTVPDSSIVGSVMIPCRCNLNQLIGFRHLALNGSIQWRFSQNATHKWNHLHIKYSRQLLRQQAGVQLFDFLGWKGGPTDISCLIDLFHSHLFPETLYVRPLFCLSYCDRIIIIQNSYWKP